MLNRVEVEGYKSIEKQTIELGALNVLIGANGSGKSNVLSVFDFVGAVVRGDLGSHVAQAGGAARILRASRQEQEMSLKFAFDPNEYRIVFRQGVAGELVVANESAAFQGKGFEEPFRINISKGSLESRLGDLADARGKATAKWVHSEMASWKRFHFHDTMPTADVRAYARVDDNHELRRNGENLAAFLYRLSISQPGHFEQIQISIRSVAPYVRGLTLAPSGINAEHIKLAWRHANSDAYFDGADLSDGTLRYIALATVLLQPDPPKLIVIDEPELGLHPKAIAHLAELLYSASKRTQVIVATQSVTLIDCLDLGDVITVDLDGDKSIFRRLDAGELAPWLEDYSLGELWQKNLLGARPQWQG